MADAGAAGAGAAAAAGGAAKEDGGSKRTPSEFLKNVLGRPVVVKLNSGVDYRGPPPRLPGRAPHPFFRRTVRKRASFFSRLTDSGSGCRVPQGSWRTWTGT